MVSGVAALIIAHFPGITPDAVRARLQNSAFPMEGPDTNGNGINDYYGYGILNAVGALVPVFTSGNDFIQVGVSANPLIPGEVLVMVQSYKQLDGPPMITWSIPGSGLGASFQLEEVASRPGFYIGRFGPGQGGNVAIIVSAMAGGVAVPKVNVSYVLAE
jgi:hypothetical protein